MVESFARVKEVEPGRDAWTGREASMCAEKLELMRLMAKGSLVANQITRESATTAERMQALGQAEWAERLRGLARRHRVEERPMTSASNPTAGHRVDA